MQKRTLGSQGLTVSALGLGCMGMSWAYGPADEKESLRVLHRAFELGIDFWDTAEIYGPFVNEELIGKALKSLPRDRVRIATKFAWTFGPKGERLALDSSPKHIKATVEGSLRRLGIETIDLYYQHRLDPNVPIEDTVGAMAELVRQGKVRYLGLSEVGARTIERAHLTHPITAIQSEYSLWERGVEEKVLPLLAKLGIGFVPYSPMGRGFLTGKIEKVEDLGEGDWRLANPRFQADNLRHNLKLVESVKVAAAAAHATPAQISLAWLLRQGENIVPIPGTKRIAYLEENAAAADLVIPDAVYATLDREVRKLPTAGLRYPEAMMKLLDT